MKGERLFIERQAELLELDRIDAAQHQEDAAKTSRRDLLAKQECAPEGNVDHGGLGEGVDH